MPRRFTREFFAQAGASGQAAIPPEERSRRASAAASARWRRLKRSRRRPPTDPLGSSDPASDPQEPAA